MEPLKYVYSEKFLNEFCIAIEEVNPNFNKEEFNKSVFDLEWESRELKQRMRHIVLCLRPHLPVNYREMIFVVLKIVEKLQQNQEKQSFEWMFIPEFIELYGIEDFEQSVSAFEIITQFTSCEFAVRPFIVKYPEKMIAQMLLWTNHNSEHVRRFATEGCRPRLPWAMALPKLKVDPSPILPILDKLKNDPSEYVRRSVANNLNDIAKDNPQLVIEIAKKWINKTKETDKLVKHACRTLLKQGNQETMGLFGFGSVQDINIIDFNIITPIVRIGEFLNFDFRLKNKCNNELLLRLEYGIYYKKANGTLARKVFKISEKKYEGNSITKIEKKQSFKIITTRKFHTGEHQVSIIINGHEYENYSFELID